MVKITFPDGSKRSFESGISVLEIANSISASLGRNALSAKVNGKIAELSDIIQEDVELQIFTWDDDDGKNAFWHSSAHVLAQTLEAFYPDVKLAIGPPIDKGFYYDVDLGDKIISEHDFEKLEKKFMEFARQKKEFQKRSVTKDKALEYYKIKRNEYKCEMINELEDGNITFCDHSDFTDLCRGGHILNTASIKAVKITGIAGAYWRGDEKNNQLTRIYGISFPKQSMLNEYLKQMDEARKRDHRKLGRELEIFAFDEDVGPGLPLWLPNGAFIIERIEELAKKIETKADYLRVKTPHIAKEKLYLTSGHLPYYKDSMYPPMELDGAMYYLKAMNCPHHHKIFSHRSRSYKEMPVRLAEYGTCYRYEKSGELFGLMRVRSLQMNDAHIYCMREQFEDEFNKVNEMYLNYFKIFGITKYNMRFSTHDPEKLGQKYVNLPELWQETEEMVRNVLKHSNIPFTEVSDEAAFYGPKIDVQVWSAIGKEFTLATNQVDFAQPLSFNLIYTNAANQSEHPIIIHRAPLSTHERLIGFLIEHYAGKFPLWLVPEQAVIIPISDRFINHAKNIFRLLKNSDIRTSIDQRNEKMGKKIRDAELRKIPYMLIIGEKEVEQETMSVRKQGEGDVGLFKINEFIKLIKNQMHEVSDIFNV